MSGSVRDRVAVTVWFHLATNAGGKLIAGILGSESCFELLQCVSRIAYTMQWESPKRQ